MRICRPRHWPHCTLLTYIAHLVLATLVLSATGVEFEVLCVACNRPSSIPHRAVHMPPCPVLRRSTGPPIAQIVCRDGSKVGCRAYKPARGSEGRISVKLARILFRRRVNHRQMLPLLRLFRLTVLQPVMGRGGVYSHPSYSPQTIRPRRSATALGQPCWTQLPFNCSHRFDSACDFIPEFRLLTRLWSGAEVEGLWSASRLLGQDDSSRV